MRSKIRSLFLACLLLQGVCLAQTDNQISTTVQLKLVEDAVVKGAALAVNVQNGVVTLSGNLSTAKQKAEATKLARSVKGVKQVVNNIQVGKK